MNNLYEYRIEVKEELLKVCRDKMRSMISSHLDPVLTNFPLVVSEIYTNLLKHSVPMPTWFNVEFQSNENYFHLILSDNGGAFYLALSYMKELDVDNNDLKVSGMGLKLIKRIFESIEYKSIQDGKVNQWRLQIPRKRKKKVALIDDDKSFLILLQAYLEQDYDVLTFYQADQALRHLQIEAVDLIVSDLNMPVLDGIQLRKKLQIIHGVTPFIFITGDKTSRLDDLAIDAIMHKPVNKVALQSCIQRVLSRHKQLRQAIGCQLSPAITQQLKPSVCSRIPGFNLNVLSRTCESGGGDFLFQRKLSKGTLIVLGDVMGHNQQAKFFVHSYLGFIQGFCYGLQEIKPVELLGALSEAICENNLLGSSLVTALAMVLYEDGHLEIASAGHPPPLVLTKSGWLPLSVMGTLPGLIPGEEYQSIEIEPECPIICYTDGLQEGLSDSCWTTLLDKTKKAMEGVNCTLSDVIDYYDTEAGIPPMDDATLLAIKPITAYKPDN